MSAHGNRDSVLGFGALTTRTRRLLRTRGWTDEQAEVVLTYVVCLEPNRDLLAISGDLDGPTFARVMAQLTTRAQSWPSSLPPNPDGDLFRVPLRPIEALRNDEFRRRLATQCTNADGEA